MNAFTKLSFWIYLAAVCLPMYSIAQGGKTAISISEFSQSLTISKEGTTDFDFGSDQDFTIEFWISVPSETTGFGGDPAIIADKDWNSGNNPGFIIFLESGAIRCNVGTGSARLDIDQDYNIQDDLWHHFALAGDRDGDLSLFVDGILLGSTPMAGFGDITSPGDIQIGRDGANNYGDIKFKMDELRIWNVAKTAEEIQTSLCLRADENNEDLLAYYRFDDESGTTIADLANGHDMTISEEGPTLTDSGAHIGDASATVYTDDWTGVEIELASTNIGSAKLYNMQMAEGAHIYYVESAPNHSNGYNPIENEGGYFAAHFAMTTPGGGVFAYNYDGYAAAEAVAADDNFALFYRLNDEALAWENTGAFNDQDAETFIIPAAGFSAHVILGKTLEGTCPNPFNIEVGNTEIISTDLTWAEDGQWSEVSYGALNFDPEMGTIISDIEASAIALEGLSPNTTYEAYVRHACAGLEPSEWVGPVAFTTLPLPTVTSFGAGNTIDFIGGDDGQNNHLNLGEIAITDNSFTVEMWINGRDVQGDPAFFSNKNWDSGNNTGFNMFMQGSGAFKVNYKTEDSERVDISSNVSIVGAWYHIAVVVNREENMTIYVNGIEVNTADISTTTGTVEGILPWMLGQDGTGAYSYGHQFDGQIDELRIWNGVRTPEQLRTNMCIRLEGTEDNLINYFPLDNTSGIVANDHANPNNYAVLMNTTDANWVLSAAAIGDVSVYAYTEGESIADLMLASEGNGTVSTSNYIDLLGAHIYRKDQAPNSTLGFDLIEGSQVQFGVFTVGTGSVAATYNYAGWNAAETNAELALFGRSDFNDAYWLNTNGVQDVGAMSFTSTLSERTELMVGTPLSGTCEEPTDFAVASSSVYSVDVTWTTGGSENWNLSYGAVGISPEQGTFVSFTSQNPYTVQGLEPETTYHIFVQDTCVGIGTSEWVGPLEITTQEIPAYLNIGAGTALSLNGNQVTSHGTPASLRPETAITVETWVNPTEFASSYVGLVSYLQDNGSDESGYGLVYNGGKVRMFIMTEDGAGNAWNSGPGAEVPLNTWSHIAGTYDGASIKFYLNGILMEEEAATGNIDWEFLPIDFRIGTFYDDNEDVHYNGQLDEMKIWDTALTAEQIRTNMCQKLAGDEENLIGYFNMNDGPGSTTITDLSANANHGTAIEDFDVNTNWTISGAHIGDESATIYGSDLITSPISVNSDMFGTLSLLANDENVAGAHVYRVNENPDSDEIDDLNADASHFGILVVGQGEVSYTYNYSAYAEAVTEADNLMLFSRANAASTIWTVGVTENNTSTQVLSGTTTASQQVYLSTNSSTCALPSGTTFSDEQISTAVLNWDNVEGATYNLIYGALGTEIQNGTEVTGLTTNEYLVEGLLSNSSFVYYIQVVCAEDEESYWVGPIAFNTLQCQAPGNIEVVEVTENSVSLSWEGGSASTYLLEWGPEGFTQGWGIQTATEELPLDIAPLAANTTYEFYVQTVCGEWGESVWMGPYTFTTEEPNGIVEYGEFNTQLYPNPAQSSITITSDLLDDNGSIQIFDVTGKLMIETNFGLNATEDIQIVNLESGVYILKINNAKSTQSIRFVKN